MHAGQLTGLFPKHYRFFHLSNPIRLKHGNVTARPLRLPLTDNRMVISCFTPKNATGMVVKSDGCLFPG
jgi:hypothetical protein